MRSALRIIASISFVLGFAGCKQGLGERCQIDSDCQSGLICSQAGTFPTCRQPATGELPDAAPPDASTAPDSAVTTPDATPVTPDAKPATADATTAD